MKTLKQLAQDALDCQSASNLSGVAHAFSRAMTDLREAIGGGSVNTHAITKLWVDKLASLAGCQSLDWDSMSAYNEVEILLNA